MYYFLFCYFVYVYILYKVSLFIFFFIFDILESSVNLQLGPAYHGLIRCDVRSKFNDVNMRKSPCNNSKVKHNNIIT